MSLENKRIALMLEQQYQELEVWYPYLRLLEAGAVVELVAPQPNTVYNSKLGYPCTSTIGVEQALEQRFDAVIVPGGWCPDFMRRNDQMIAFIIKCAERENMVLAAICHGGWMLCCTDALKGKRATSFVAIKHDMINAGAKWVDEECVIDGRLITSRKPEDLPAFCRAIIEKLSA
jgi:protease I